MRIKIVGSLFALLAIFGIKENSLAALKKTESVQKNLGECVILLHGLARTSKSMEKLARSLKDSGYFVANISYPSRKKPIEELANIAISQGLEQCYQAKSRTIHCVTHSLGGILIRYYLAHNTIDTLGRVVMLAPPNQGSEVVDNWKNVPGFSLINGPAGLQLGTDSKSVPLHLGAVDYPVGIIAGNKSINPLLSLSLPNPDDGKVSVQRTKVAGMTEHIVMPISHSFIMRNKKVIMQVKSFLQSGQFMRD